MVTPGAYAHPGREALFAVMRRHRVASSCFSSKFRKQTELLITCIFVAIQLFLLFNKKKKKNHFQSMLLSSCNQNCPWWHIDSTMIKQSCFHYAQYSIKRQAWLLLTQTAVATQLLLVPLWSYTCECVTVCVYVVKQVILVQCKAASKRETQAAN